jgi:hypothetical protein
MLVLELLRILADTRIIAYPAFTKGNTFARTAGVTTLKEWLAHVDAAKAAPTLGQGPDLMLRLLTIESRYPLAPPASSSAPAGQPASGPPSSAKVLPVGAPPQSNTHFELVNNRHHLTGRELNPPSPKKWKKMTS